jgi:hypothetical protein
MTDSMKTLLRTSLPLVVAVAAGCQDTTGPSSLDRLDANAVLRDYAAIDSVLSSRAWTSFQMAANGMNAATIGGGAAAAVSGAQELKQVATGDARAFATAMAGVAAGADGASQGPLISDFNRGRTYIYDAQGDRWLIDPSRTDAPATGVRFIIYEPNGAKPDPTKPIGHADIIDLGDNVEGIALRLVVVDGSMTVVDYTTTLNGDNGSGRITVDGFIQNQRDRLDFDVDVHGQNVGGAEQADVTFELGIAAREFSVTGDLHADKQGGVEAGTVDLLVRHGAQSFRVDIENQAGQLAGVIDLNDAPFATVSGPAHRPVFTTPSGDPIRGLHALALWRIFDVTEDVFDLFEDLLEPIAGLVIIAIIL